jgi:hypothetical protein
MRDTDELGAHLVAGQSDLRVAMASQIAELEVWRRNRQSADWRQREAMTAIVMRIANGHDRPAQCRLTSMHIARRRGKPYAGNRFVGLVSYANWPQHEVMPTSARDKVFISYSHKDRKFLEEFLVHLRPLERSGLVTAWSDRQIPVGSKWFEEIRRALSSARIAVLMVTPSFLASDFINEHELGPLLKDAEDGGLRIIWVPVRASSYRDTVLAKYQAVIPPDKPLAEMKAERDKAWVRVCENVKHTLNPI